MARKKRNSAGGGLVIVVAALIALLAQVPKEIWFAIIGIAAVIVIARAVVKRRDHHDPVPLRTPQPSQQRERSRTVRLTANAHELPFAQHSSTTFPTSISLDTTVSVPDRSIPRPPTGEIAYKAKWIAAGEGVTVAGINIPGGMIYAGLSLQAPNGRQEPALINPSLRVSSATVNISERQMPYWPSYSEISPEARKAYLQWLASGRQDPTAEIGYVFLFFYGLERRALIDLQSRPDDPEISLIEREIRRLLSIYQNNSFRNYATNFLGYLNTASLGELPLVPPQESRTFELPISYRMALGQFAAARKPLPAAWAFAWADVDPTIFFRTPAQRCRDQFRDLFLHRYTEQFGDGLILPLNKTKLRISYRPASGGLLGTVLTRDIGNVPDVGAITGPQKKLQDLVNRCTDELDKYSRYLGRNPDKGNSIDGLLLLPESVWPEATRSEIDKLKKEVAQQTATTKWKDLIKRLGANGDVARTTSAQFASCLESSGIGIEPDLTRSRMPEPEDPVVVFATSARNDRVMSGASYAAASITLEFGAMIAAADGEVHDTEVQHLAHAIALWDGLDEAARNRLTARLALFTVQPPSLTSLRKKAGGLSPSSRRTIADLLIMVIQADGVVSPAEVKLLESAYKVLQLDTKLVYSDLHSGIPTGRQIGKGITKSSAAARPLNAERIAQLQQETDRMAVVLNEVFTTRDESATVEDTAVGADSPADIDEGFLGLDAQHSHFARLLLSRPQWSRAELADAAADMDLMLDGALERINDVAIERFEQPLVDGEDPVEIDQTIMEQVLA